MTAKDAARGCTEKKCIKCGVVSQPSFFPNDKKVKDGKINVCKSCNNAYRRAYRAAHDKQTKEVRAIHRKATTTDWSKYKSQYKQRFPLRYKAQWAVYKAVKKGLLVKSPCCICGDVNAKAHHDDYTKPLDVKYLCHKHHMAWHTLFLPVE